jgi:hypothetical protein
METLLSHPAPECAAITSPNISSTSPARTYTLSTHMIGTLYFIGLKTTNKQILKRAVSLISHPELRHTRDGLWDARTTAFIVDNLIKVRQNGNVTEGADTSDLRMHVSEQDSGVNVAELRRVFKMSEETGLPMMQSKKFTLVVRKQSLVTGQGGRGPCISASMAAGSCPYGTYNGSAFSTIKLSSSHLTRLPIPPRSMSTKDFPFRAYKPTAPVVSLRGSRNGDYENSEIEPQTMATPAFSPTIPSSQEARPTPSLPPYRLADYARANTVPIMASWKELNGERNTGMLETLRSESATPFLERCLVDGFESSNGMQSARLEDVMQKKTDGEPKTSTAAVDPLLIDLESILGATSNQGNQGQPTRSRPANGCVHTRKCSGYEEEKRLWERHRQGQYVGAG